MDEQLKILAVEFRKYHTENAERDQQTIEYVNAIKQDVQQIHSAITKLISESKNLDLERNEALVKDVRKASFWNAQNAKFTIGSVLLLAITIIIFGAVFYTNPQDVLDQFRRFLPLVGTTWVTYLAYLIYGIRPPEKNESLSINRQDNRDPIDSPQDQ